jgi:hypothetical protein
VSLFLFEVDAGESIESRYPTRPFRLKDTLVSLPDKADVSLFCSNYL